VNLLTAADLFPKKVSTYNPGDAVDAHVLMPEYLTCEDKSEQVANHVIEWLYQPAKCTARVAELAALKEHVGHGGASRRAADYVLDALSARSRPALRTHYSFATPVENAMRDAA
jgi:lipid-A-disaccharide synthase